MQLNQIPLGAPLPPPVQVYLQAPLQPPIRPPVQHTYERHPVYSASQAAPQSNPPNTNPPNTNPLGTAPSSVIEDETKRLPDKQS